MKDNKRYEQFDEQEDPETELESVVIEEKDQFFYLNQIPTAITSTGILPLLQPQDINNLSISSTVCLKWTTKFKYEKPLDPKTKTKYLKDLNESTSQLSNLERQRRRTLIWSILYGLFEAGLITSLAITTQIVNQYAQQLDVLGDQWHDPFNNSTLNCEDKIENFHTNYQLHRALLGKCNGAESCLNINSTEAKVCWLIAEAFKLIAKKTDGPSSGQILSALVLPFSALGGILYYFVTPYYYGGRINFLTIKPFVDLKTEEAKPLVKFWNKQGLGGSKIVLKNLTIAEVRAGLQKVQDKVNTLSS